MTRPSRPRSRLTRLEHDLAEVLGEETLGPLLAITRLRKTWPEIVGPMMAARTEPVRIEDYADEHGPGRRLWVAVDHSTMAQQIRMLRGDILRACRTRAHTEGLTQIRTQLLAGAGIRPDASGPRAAPVPLRLRKAIAQSLKQMDNDNLRRAIFEARVAQLAYTDSPESANLEGTP
ncbi:MAG TPA: DUF721 domain-containing protein [Mariprofundaceae bacterium]|nr:DUF721 domain-containing protein [Mariprofundaceae bacterium]